jgi:chemotaxis protein histidine kinase CheA
MRRVNLASFLGEFKTESLEHLERLGSGLLALERDPANAELIRKLFMSAHTIKGGSSMLELKALKILTHAFEDVLTRLRDGKDRADAATVTLLLRTTDEIKALVEDNPTLEAPTPELEGLIERLRARARGEAVELEPSQPETLTLETATPKLDQNRAVVLEPSDTARLLLQLQLEARGWTVVSVADEVALASSLDGVRLAVLSVEPGGVDGLALGAKLRASHPKLELAVSGLTFSEAQTRAAEHIGARVVPLTSWRENPWMSP